MDTFYSQGILWIVFVCLFVLCVVFSRQKRNLILTFAQRGILGFVTIFCLNRLFAYLSLNLFVGINVWTLCISACLGIPGVGMLFCLTLL